jgi:hypothetical protein
MRFTILLPHYKTGKMTAVALYHLLNIKNKEHEMDIVVIDNNTGDGSIDYLSAFMEHITVVEYPKELMQSHGIAFNHVIPHIKTEYFITMESDSFPTMENWLGYYAFLAENKYDVAGSLLSLSGGHFMHPCGAMYKKSNWLEAEHYCRSVNYDYYPAALEEDGHRYHLMVKKGLSVPQGYSIEEKERYKPITGVFHNGMGARNESINTFSARTIQTEPQYILLNGKQDTIKRVGYEPGQWFCYWHIAMGKKMYYIPTYTKWMANRVGQQQEFTMMENGFKHLWGMTSYHKAAIAGLEDIIDFKARQVEDLYNALPEQYKIPAENSGDNQNPAYENESIKTVPE